MAKCKDCFFYGCCILNRCSAEADVFGCKIFELESLERKKDLVEVVRCKDCKHCKKYTNRFDPIPNRQLCNRMYDYAYRVEEDDFCSYGERREGE